MEKLTGETRRVALAELAGWSEAEGRDAICKTFRFAAFNEAFTFMTSTALIAREDGPSPRMVQRLQQRGGHARTPPPTPALSDSATSAPRPVYGPGRRGSTALRMKRAAGVAAALDHSARLAPLTASAGRRSRKSSDR